MSNRPATTSGTTSPEAPAAESGASTQQSDARYASQAAAAKPSPVAFEGGAAAPSSNGGMTPRREWLFLVLAVFFSIVFISVPAVLFTSIDLTAAAGEEGGTPAGSDAARAVQRLQVLQETRADALAKLYTYGPADEAGRYRIPVEQAMQLTLQEDYAPAAGSRSVMRSIPGGASRQ